MAGGSQAPRIWRLVASGLALRVRVTPKSSREVVAGLMDTRDGPALKVAVRAVPEDGAANTAVERLIADWLSLPQGRVSVTSGATSRVKVLTIGGGDAGLGAEIDRRLSDA